KKVPGAPASRSASSTASVHRPFGPSSNVSATVGADGEPRRYTSRSKSPSGSNTPPHPPTSTQTARRWRGGGGAVAAPLRRHVRRGLLLVLARPGQLGVRVLTHEGAVEVLVHGDGLLAVPEDERDGRMTGGLELDAVLPHLEHLDARAEGDERPLQVVDVADVGLLVVHVAAEIAGLA